jgi:hypothetical protein
METFILILVLVVIVSVVAGALFKSSQKTETLQRQTQQKTVDREALSALDLFLSRNRLPIYHGTVPIMLKADEYPIVCSDSRLAEERSIGNYTGMSFRVARGMYYRTGQSTGDTELRIIDTGKLVLTTKRLVFVGSKRTASTELRKLVNVDHYADAITIHKDGKAKAETYFLDTPSVYKLILEALNKFSFRKETDSTLVADGASK